MLHHSYAVTSHLNVNIWCSLHHLMRALVGAKRSEEKGLAWCKTHNALSIPKNQGGNNF